MCWCLCLCLGYPDENGHEMPLNASAGGAEDESSTVDIVFHICISCCLGVCQLSSILSDSPLFDNRNKSISIRKGDIMQELVVRCTFC